MTLEESATALREAYPFFQTYRFNDYGAPILNGMSPVDMGIALLFLEELGTEANCVNLSDLLSVTQLTCKNWIKKLREECLCDIVWQSKTKVGRYFEIKSTGIFNVALYDNFRFYVKLVITNWKTKKNEL